MNSAAWSCQNSRLRTSCIGILLLFILVNFKTPEVAVIRDKHKQNKTVDSVLTSLIGIKLY